MKIYVGNLNYRTSEKELKELFERHGAVESCAIVNDRETGKPKGFGFVEMLDARAAKSAIDTLDGKEFDGRKLVVRVANPPKRK